MSAEGFGDSDLGIQGFPGASTQIFHPFRIPLFPNQRPHVGIAGGAQVGVYLSLELSYVGNEALGLTFSFLCPLLREKGSLRAASKALTHSC